jgi:hypothetical protein
MTIPTAHKHHHKKEHWLNSYWRPMMGWSYFAICLFDFLVAPILWTLAQATFHGAIQTQWQPITLLGGGLYHISMGVILGVSSYGRTQEKLSGVANNNMPSPMACMPVGGLGSTYVPPSPASMNQSNYAPADSSTVPVNSPVSTQPITQMQPTVQVSPNITPITTATSSPIVSSVNGKLAPPQTTGPEL